MSKDWPLTGVDYFQEHRAFFASEGGVGHEVLDVFPSNSFDVVTANSFLGHTDSRRTSPMLGFRNDLADPHYLAFEAQVFA